MVKMTALSKNKLMTMTSPVVYSMFERSDSYWGRMAMTSNQEKHFNDRANLKRFQCINCPQQFKNVSKLSTHVTDKHMKFTYKCADCEKIFCSKSALSMHRRSANACLSWPRGGDLVLGYQCGECGKTFTTPHSRTYHTKSLVDGKCPGKRMNEKKSARKIARNFKLNDNNAIKRKSDLDSAEKGLKSAKANIKNTSRSLKRKSHMRDQCELDPCPQCDQVWQIWQSLSDAKARVKTAKKKYRRKYQYRNIEIDLRTLASQLNIEIDLGTLASQLNSQETQLRTIDSLLRALDE